ncbi:hypothetical protein BVRB_4g088840 [Beta vulgaris subsp. vulgaris]|nr:hypothetical protein BVRB_4g088840 [Beta vulgaris subsp. vulgaris]
MGQVPEFHGPYGSQLPENYRIELKDGRHITELIIRHHNIVDGIGFVIATPEGGTSFEKLGGNGGKESKIVFKDGESITRISGTYGYCRFRKEDEVSSLKIHTNLSPEGYGPFGKSMDVEAAYEFSSPDLSDSLILGFFGTHNNFLLSIGVISKKRQVIKRNGPYGSQLPQNYDMQLKDGEHIKEVIIRHGLIVDAIGFMIAKLGGGTTTKIFGGNGGKETKIILKEGEYITKVSGKHGCDRDSKQCMVVMLKIHTNFFPKGYGPHGLGGQVDDLHDFSSPLSTDGPIVGIFGRKSNYLESLGVITRSKDSQRQVIESYGPYGSKLPNNYSMQLKDGERISEVRLTHGWLIDAIGFRIAKPGEDTTTVMFGGVGADQSQIVLKDGEYLTRISGTCGYNPSRSVECISTLKIHTNICPVGYGPYALGLDVPNPFDFSSPRLIDGPVVGVFGRRGKVLESIGVLMKKGNVIESYGPYGSQILQNYRMQLRADDRISEVRVTHGYIVNAIEFVIANPHIGSTIVKFGGNGQKESKIVLEDVEFITRVSGTYGYDRDQKQEGIAALKIHTNLCPVGYGPYGFGMEVDDIRDFSSPLLNDGPIVGVFGTHGENLESIGVLLKKDFPSS